MTSFSGKASNQPTSPPPYTASNCFIGFGFGDISFNKGITKEDNASHDRFFDSSDFDEQVNAFNINMHISGSHVSAMGPSNGNTKQIIGYDEDDIWDELRKPNSTKLRSLIDNDYNEEQEKNRIMERQKEKNNREQEKDAQGKIRSFFLFFSQICFLTSCLLPSPEKRKKGSFFSPKSRQRGKTEMALKLPEKDKSRAEQGKEKEKEDKIIRGRSVTERNVSPTSTANLVSRKMAGKAMFTSRYSLPLFCPGRVYRLTLFSLRLKVLL